MSSLVSKSQHSLSKPEDINNNTNTTKDQEILNSVTSFIYLKPAHSTETRDKAEVLQRIRQRKRANKVREWVDDAFAAP
ncbi:hypothetical protein NC651_006245 [Populus alba x Populus x berolinensis]|nr:hypothetical protein NC651_006245 [Populus alba x Populus x berolinensis]